MISPVLGPEIRIFKSSPGDSVAVGTSHLRSGPVHRFEYVLRSLRISKSSLGASQRQKTKGHNWWGSAARSAERTFFGLVFWWFLACIAHWASGQGFLLVKNLWRSVPPMIQRCKVICAGVGRRQEIIGIQA